MSSRFVLIELDEPVPFSAHDTVFVRADDRGSIYLSSKVMKQGAKAIRLTPVEDDSDIGQRLVAVVRAANRTGATT